MEAEQLEMQRRQIVREHVARLALRGLERDPRRRLFGHLARVHPGLRVERRSQAHVGLECVLRARHQAQPLLRSPASGPRSLDQRRCERHLLVCAHQIERSRCSGRQPRAHELRVSAGGA
jgi:hypothetical protein